MQHKYIVTQDGTMGRWTNYQVREMVIYIGNIYVGVKIQISIFLKILRGFNGGLTEV